MNDRNADFRAVPILGDYIACILQDLQYSENDNARKPRDTGTIYTLREETYERCKADCEQFIADCADHISEALDMEPGEPGLQYGRDYITHERIGSTLWLARCGSGVAFTDDGDAPSLQAMEQWADANDTPEPYIGDDGEIYLI